MTIARRFVVLFACLSLLVAACGDDDAFDSATTAPGDGDTPATTSGDSPATTAGALPSGEGDIADLIELAAQVPLRNTYLMGEGADADTITLSQDPTRNPPVSAVIMYAGSPGAPEEGRVVTIGDQTTFCGPPEENICFASPPGTGSPAEAMLGPIFGFFYTVGIEDTPGFDVDESLETIAGRQALCFTITPDAMVGADVEFVRQCVDAELGFTVLVEGQDAGGGTVERFIELIEYGTPQPSDFELTGDLMDVPGS